MIEKVGIVLYVHNHNCTEFYPQFFIEGLVTTRIRTYVPTYLRGYVLHKETSYPSRHVQYGSVCGIFYEYFDIFLQDLTYRTIVY